MDNPFDGIAQKLYRSKENIRNLEIEIERFFKDSKYPSLIDENKELVLEALEYHRDRAIPLRFAVLAGEIIHQQRSILDHIVWQFSDPSYRQAHMKWIEFPILEARPAAKDVFTRYERKIKGVTKPIVRSLIEALQPYNCPDPIDSAMLIIHNFDVIDKHRELVIVVSTPAIQMPMEVMQKAIKYQCGVPGLAPIDFKKEFEAHGEIVPQVAFDEFGRTKAEPIVQALSALQNFLVHVIADFDKLR
jgi:hypothetical protein